MSDAARGRLYVVGTPIGNLDDITYRAVASLERVSAILCEDTRHSGKLLAKLGLSKPLLSLHAHSSDERISKLVERLTSGEELAYITDAGTPGVSDPGASLVDSAREAGVEVVPIPGPSALTAILSVAGRIPKTVIFEGFLSPKAGRRKRRLEELFAMEAACVFFESPHRILALLEAVEETAPGAEIVLGRELTKMYEELLVGSVGEVLHEIRNRQRIKGELVVLVSPGEKS
jgi:16S rRNA (cytidine1402-2'-O)-methyltransferase